MPPDVLLLADVHPAAFTVWQQPRELHQSCFFGVTALAVGLSPVSITRRYPAYAGVAAATAHYYATDLRSIGRATASVKSPAAQALPSLLIMKYLPLHWVLYRPVSDLTADCPAATHDLQLHAHASPAQCGKPGRHLRAAVPALSRIARARGWLESAPAPRQTHAFMPISANVLLRHSCVFPLFRFSGFIEHYGVERDSVAARRLQNSQTRSSPARTQEIIDIGVASPSTAQAIIISTV